MFAKESSTHHCNKQFGELRLPPPLFTSCFSSLLVGLTSQASPTSRPCSASQAALWSQLGCWLLQETAGLDGCQRLQSCLISWYKGHTTNLAAAIQLLLVLTLALKQTHIHFVHLHQHGWPHHCTCISTLAAMRTCNTISMCCSTFILLCLTLIAQE